MRIAIFNVTNVGFRKKMTELALSKGRGGKPGGFYKDRRVAKLLFAALF